MVLCALGILAWPLVALSQAPVKSQVKNEQQAKAAIVLAFAKYTQWPATAFASTNAPLIIGVLGKPSFGNILDRYNQQKVKGHTLSIKQCNSVEEAAACHLVFVGASEKANLNRILERLKQPHTLTVGETEKFIESGGMAKLWSKESPDSVQVKFQINKQAVGEAKLDIATQFELLSEPEPTK